MSRPRKYQVPPNHHPFILWLDEEIKLQELSETKVAMQAGLTKTLVTQWRLGKTPSIANFDAALSVLGYKLAIVDKNWETEP